MDIAEVSAIISRIAEGFEAMCLECLEKHQGVIVDSVKEQLWSGQRGDGKLLEPTYDNDPFFEEEGRWYHKQKQYKAWKKAITPPSSKVLLTLPPRPDNIPNLFIRGDFYDTIEGRMVADGLDVTSTKGIGPEIKQKYGEEIFNLGDPGKSYFNKAYLEPYIEEFFKKCGYV